MSEQKSNTNDYAVAQALNERVWKVLWYFAELHPLYPKDLDVVNRNYIFLVQELMQIYEGNKELQGITPKAAWQRFELIDGNEEYIVELQDDRTGDTGQAHTAKVKRLCIISGIEEPTLTPHQKKLIDEADKIIATLIKNVEEESAQLEAIRQNKRDWYISEYKLTYDVIKGAIKINDVYQLNKRSTNDGSNIDNLLKQAIFENPNKLFVPELNQTKKNLSTILNNAGFDTTLRQLFFTTAREDRGVFCRPAVTRAEADAEGIDTTELDIKLKEAGAITKSTN
jgi:hypothetical protein